MYQAYIELYNLMNRLVGFGEIDSIFPFDVLSSCELSFAHINPSHPQIRLNKSPLFQIPSLFTIFFFSMESVKVILYTMYDI